MKICLDYKLPQHILISKKPVKEASISKWKTNDFSMKSLDNIMGNMYFVCSTDLIQYKSQT